MAVRIKSITFDCTDPFRLARFWAAATGFAEDPANGNAPDDPEALLLAPDGAAALLFIAVPEPKQVNNRVHLDLVPLDRRRDTQTDDLLALGAHLVADRRRADGSGWVVLADPEGNEFCVERSDSERATAPGAPSRLRRAIVVRVGEDACDVVLEDGTQRPVGYASMLPSPRSERFSPGHLVAVTTTSTGGEIIVWRWFDAVVLDAAGDRLRLWEPAHGEVLAVLRNPTHPVRPGTRAYLSAGLPGADWWVAGDVVSAPRDAVVELDEVARFYDRHGLWGDLG